MAADSVQKIVLDTLDAAFSSAALAQLLDNEVGPLAVALINQHVSAGRYMSGEYAEKGYSENILPAFFLGDITKSGDDWAIRSTAFNVTVKPNDDEFIWRWSEAGNGPTGYLVGGYKAFRRLAGRQTSVVNLTFTGRMLNSVRHRAIVSGSNTFRLEVGATGGEQDKAYYTDRQREWLVLFGDEQETIKKVAEDYLKKQIDKLPNETIRIRSRL